MKKELKKLKETRAVAENYVAPDPRSRAGHEMLRRQAEADLPVVKAQFQAAFKKVAFPVFLTGPNTKSFEKEAAEIAEVIAVDDVLANLRQAVKVTVGPSKEFGVPSFTVLLRELRQLGVSLGWTSIPNIDYKGVEYVDTDEKLNEVINSYFNNGLDAVFLSALVLNEASAKAEALSGKQPVVPVLISGLPEDSLDTLGPVIFGTKYLVVDTTNLTDKTVTETFEKIKKTLKTKE